MRFGVFYENFIKNYSRSFINLLLETNVEKRVEFISNKYNIEPSTVEKIIQSDPTKGKNIDWLIRQFKTGEFSTIDLFIQKMSPILTEYEMIKKFLAKLPKEQLETFLNSSPINFNNKSFQDINSFKNYTELESFIYYSTPAVKEIKQQEEREKNIEVIYKTPRFLLLSPNTMEASIKYGKNTKWCTAANDKDSNPFWNYHSRGQLYILIDKIKNEKFQFQFINGSPSHMDETDTPIIWKDFVIDRKEIMPVLKRLAHKHNDTTTLSLPIFERTKYEYTEDVSHFLQSINDRNWKKQLKTLTVEDLYEGAIYLLRFEPYRFDEYPDDFISFFVKNNIPLLELMVSRNRVIPKILEVYNKNHKIQFLNKILSIIVNVANDAQFSTGHTEKIENFLSHIPQSILIEFLNRPGLEYIINVNPKQYIAYYLNKLNPNPDTFKIILPHFSSGDKGYQIKNYVKKHDYPNLDLSFYLLDSFITHLSMYGEISVAKKYIEKNLSLNLIKSLVHIRIYNPRNPRSHSSESIFLYLKQKSINKIQDIIMEKGDINLLSNFLDLSFEHDFDFDVQKLQKRDDLDLLSFSIVEKLLKHKDNQKIFYKTVNSDRFIEKFRRRISVMLNSTFWPHFYREVDILDIANIFDEVPSKLKSAILDSIDTTKYWINNFVNASNKGSVLNKIKKLTDENNNSIFGKDDDIRKAIDSALKKVDSFIK